MMRKWCPNFDNQDGLDTVLEVPIPEEMFTNMANTATVRWHNMRSWMKYCPRPGNKSSGQQSSGGSTSSSLSSSNHNNSNNNNSNSAEFMLLLKIVGSPLIPIQVQIDNAWKMPVRDGSIESSTAKYIVQQYIAASGGPSALSSVNSMYAVGQVKMVSSDMQQSNNDSSNAKNSCEVGGFVLWQKNPNLWFLELVVAGNKISAGSDGTMAWSQSSSQHSHASKGPPRPLRRFFQGLDPKSTANLFINGVCIGEKIINKEACFILKVEIASNILRAQSSPKTEIIHHRIWGYFSQRTGLLIQFEDSKLVRMQVKGDDSVFWETSMESVIEDYRYIDGINIAHSGRTAATIYRYGKSLNHRGKIEETWRIEEVDFNICGLSMDSFLPPADVKREQEQEEGGGGL